MVAARTHAPGKRGPSFRKSYAGGNSARVVYSQGANQGLQGFAPRQVCTLGSKGGIQFTPFVRSAAKVGIGKFANPNFAPVTLRR